MVLLSLLKTFSWQEQRQHPWRNAAAELILLLDGQWITPPLHCGLRGWLRR